MLYLLQVRSLTEAILWTLFKYLTGSQENEKSSLRLYNSIMFMKSAFQSLFVLRSAWDLNSGQSSQNSQNYTFQAEAALATLQTWYNTTSGIWDTTGWWNSANCLTVLGDLAAVDPRVEAQATEVFANTLVQAQKQYLKMTKVINHEFLMYSSYGNYAVEPSCLCPGVLSLVTFLMI